MRIYTDIYQQEKICQTFPSRNALGTRSNRFRTNRLIKDKHVNISVQIQTETAAAPGQETGSVPAAVTRSEVTDRSRAPKHVRSTVLCWRLEPEGWGLEPGAWSQSLEPEPEPGPGAWAWAWTTVEAWVKVKAFRRFPTLSPSFGWLGLCRPFHLSEQTSQSASETLPAVVVFQAGWTMLLLN